MRKPDFTQLQKVLERRTPDRPTLFEFFLNDAIHRRLTGIENVGANEDLQWCRTTMKAYEAAGYDYVTLHSSNFQFPAKEHAHMASVSQNDSAVINDRESFKRYDWPSPDDFDNTRLDEIAKLLPEGMKIIPYGPCGVLENAVKLCGYENLAMMVMDDPQLVEEIFEAVGSRLVRYYELAGHSPKIGAMISNDDWGFAQQTMLSPADMRRFVFPWHKRIVKTIHAAGVPAILHSCGNLRAVMDDLIDDIGYDAKHSYEDKIMPVEEAYATYGSRIAILGGIDLDFVCRSTPDKIHHRARAMLELTRSKGGYALGTGNSVPDYVPHDNYIALVKAANPDIHYVC